MMLWVLVVTTLFVSDVAGMGNSSEVKETLRAIGEITRGRCENGWYEYSPTRSCYHCFTTSKTWKNTEDKNFIWNDESSIRYLNWANGRPLDPKYRQQCVVTNYGSPGVWLDMYCNRAYNYVCAYKLH
ncbi:C-type lectin lectoxin-Enh1-like [Mobula hypostoma]|uniref:C-type lectin lectoxin-Enh1-like n=1 Tax=Mobula hypostoma TaxID=723540 RepID=UPI002FC33AEE